MNTIFSGPVMHLLSVLCVLMKILFEKKTKTVSDFALSLVDLACDIMAVKGLTSLHDEDLALGMLFSLP